MNRRFKLNFSQELLADRQMPKREYKSYNHFLRESAFIMHNRINWPKFDRAVMDSMLYGAKVNPEELLL